MVGEEVIINNKEYEIGHDSDLICPELLGKVLDAEVGAVLGFENENSKVFFWYVLADGTFKQWQSINDIVVLARKHLISKLGLAVSVTEEPDGTIMVSHYKSRVFTAESEVKAMFAALRYYYDSINTCKLEFQVTPHFGIDKMKAINTFCNNAGDKFKGIVIDKGIITFEWSKLTEDVEMVKETIETYLNLPNLGAHLDYRIEKLWITNEGFQAAVLLNCYGRRCGYVQSDPSIDVHNIDPINGITYSSKGFGYPGLELENAWYVGFDFNSAFVKPDKESVERVFGESHYTETRYVPGKDFVTLDECINRCHSISLNITMLKHTPQVGPDVWKQQFQEVLCIEIPKDELDVETTYCYKDNLRHEELFPVIDRAIDLTRSRNGFSNIKSFCILNHASNHDTMISAREVTDLYKHTSTPCQMLPKIGLHGKQLRMTFIGGAKLHFNITAE